MPIAPLRVALLFSGEGEIATAVFQAWRSTQLYRVRPALAIASRRDAGGIVRLIQAGFPLNEIEIVDPQYYREEPEGFGRGILKACRERGVDVISQCDWDPPMPLSVSEAYGNTIIKNHPGPLDPGRLDFGGEGMRGRAVQCARILFVRMAKRDYWTDATVYLTSTGAVLGLATIPISENENPILLQERVLPKESRVYINVLGAFADGRVKEIVREHPLILPGEEEIFAEAKRMARMLFPCG